jgi:hypothetical protein
MAEANSSGLGFTGALALLFIGPKLGGVIAWSWWWVTVPLWGPVAIAIILVAAMALLD